MPRQSRIDFPGALHHVIVRGLERRKLFWDDLDYRNFLDRLEIVLEKTKTRCHAFSLMPNHVHMLLVTGKTPLSRMMQSLLTGYAGYFNRRHRRNGKMYQNRYKSILCDRDEYLKELVRYIHLNPLRARIVKDMNELDGYPWAGHGAYIGHFKGNYVDSEDVLGLFGGHLREARERYREFVREGMGQGRRTDLTGGGIIRSLGGEWEAVGRAGGPKGEQGDERILGRGWFVEEVMAAAREHETERSRLRRKGWDFEKVLSHAAQAVGVKKEELFRRGHNDARSQGRALVCKWMVDDIGEIQADVAKRFRISRPAVSAAVARGRQIERELEIGIS